MAISGKEHEQLGLSLPPCVTSIKRCPVAKFDSGPGISAMSANDKGHDHGFLLMLTLFAA